MKTRLSPHARKVLRLVVVGITSADAKRQWGIDEGVFYKYRARLLHNFGVNTPYELLHAAIERRYLDRAEWLNLMSRHYGVEVSQLAATLV